MSNYRFNAHLIEVRGSSLELPSHHKYSLESSQAKVMGWDQGWVMAFPLVSSLFGGVEYDMPSLNHYCSTEKIFILVL